MAAQITASTESSGFAEGDTFYGLGTRALAVRSLRKTATTVDRTPSTSWYIFPRRKRECTSLKGIEIQNELAGV